uniref:MFS transporter 6 n=1 Tax=Limenitis arthemis astyanax TaxID=324813 RepID=A0A6B9UQP6_LIMAT|nr:MFS transporter 6 [Limenitis arthemis astyanax]
MVVNGKMEKSAKDETSVATLDEAMLLTGFGIYNIAHMLMSGLILMGVIMQSLLMSYVLPAAQCDLDLSLQQRGWLAAIPFLAIILTSYFWGWLADTRGRRFVMLFSMMISVVLAVLASFAPDIITFGVFSFFSAMFMSASSAVIYTYLGEFTNLRHRDKMVAFGSSFVGIGTVVLPAISWLILPLEFSLAIEFLNIAYRPWRLLIVACSVPFVIGTIFLTFAPESPKFLSASGRVEECLAVLRKMYSVNRRMPEDSYPVKTLITEFYDNKPNESKGIILILTSMRDQTAPLFKTPLLPWTCLTCFVQFGLFATTNGFYVWFPTILNSLANHDGAETRICDVLDASQTTDVNGTEIICDDTMNTSTFELSIYIGLVFCSMYILVGFLVDSIGKKVILVVLLTITGLCGIGAHLAYNQQLAVVLFAIFQMCGACIGLMNAVTVELFPTKFRAMAVCLSMMMGRVGSMAASNLIGVFLATNCGASFYLFGAIIIVCALLCLTLPGKNRGPISSPLTETSSEIQEPV